VNTLTLVGKKAMRARLLAELRLTQWNMAHTAERLRLGSSAHVLRYIDELGLHEEHANAKARGLLSVGGRRKRVEIPRDRRAV
jgi:ribosomal protein L28